MDICGKFSNLPPIYIHNSILVPAFVSANLFALTKVPVFFTFYLWVGGGTGSSHMLSTCWGEPLVVRSYLVGLFGVKGRTLQGLLVWLIAVMWFLWFFLQWVWFDETRTRSQRFLYHCPLALQGLIIPYPFCWSSSWLLRACLALTGPYVIS
jgi:hypothetical protein